MCYAYCVVSASILEQFSAVINCTCKMDSIVAMEEDVSPENLQVLSCRLYLLVFNVVESFCAIVLYDMFSD